ncbi:MAG: head-tail connector protein [Erythrobacter sp.]
MRRTIVESADVRGNALAELKSWLGISRPNEDELLVDLLQASLAMCEAFTGQVPLWQLLEERLPVRSGRHPIVTRPIATSIVTVELVNEDGSRTLVDAADYELELESDGSACFRLDSDLDGQGVAVRVRAGIAGIWDEIPAGLKQGLIRLAAYLYRDRDTTTGSRAQAGPPASVAALWQPWRVLRLA